MGVGMERLRELSRPTGEEDLMAVRYPEPRLRISVGQAAGGAVLLFLLLAGWWLLHGAEPDGVVASDPPVEVVVAASSTGTSVPEVDRLVVAVVGAVPSPGLATVSSGARVADALEHSGVDGDADLAAINVARRLSDGEQIRVPRMGEVQGDPAQAAGLPEEVPAGTVGESSLGKISVNTASAAELVALPGVGEATAAAIVAHREANGAFRSIDDLLDVRGIGPAKLEALRDQVTL